MNELLWFVSRATGTASIVLLTAVLVLGALTAGRRSRAFGCAGPPHPGILVRRRSRRQRCRGARCGRCARYPRGDPRGRFSRRSGHPA